MRIFSVLSSIALVTAISGCASFPSSGPGSRVIVSSAMATRAAQPGQASYRYALVNLDQNVVESLPVSGPGSLGLTFGFGRGEPQRSLIGPGDVLQVTIFESAAGGLFIPADAGARPGNFVQLPATAVDSDGAIYVPYAGRIDASGRTAREVGANIESKLQSRAIEPKVTVTIVSQKGSDLTVMGEVNSPSRIPVSVAGDRLLDILAKSGGIKNPGYETYVTLRRGAKGASVFFDDIVANDDENIFVRPGDTIYVYKQPKSFIVMGASGQSGRFEFGAPNLYLAEAVAKGGGLNDGRADPRSVFVYRLESRASLARMGVNLAEFPAEEQLIPTVYRADFGNPASFFTAQKFAMRDRDTVYVSNASAVQVAKFLNLINMGTGTITGMAKAVTDTDAAVKVFEQ